MTDPVAGLLLFLRRPDCYAVSPIGRSLECNESQPRPLEPSQGGRTQHGPSEDGPNGSKDSQ